MDGKPVRSLAEYYRAMESVTPGKLVITVRDAGGNSADWTTESRSVAGNPQSSQPQHENSGEPAKLYLVIVADTHARGIGHTVKADLGNVEGLFRGYIPARRLRVTTLSDDEVNPRNVLLRNSDSNARKD